MYVEALTVECPYCKARIETIDALTALAEKYVGAQSTRELETQVYNDTKAIIANLYAQGGYILDRSDKPIFNFTDVEIVVNRRDHQLSISIVRRMH